LVHYDETTLVGDPSVTAWTNKGTGGSAYDIVAEATRGSLNSLDTFEPTSGSALNETAAIQSIGVGLTVLIVVTPRDVNPSRGYISDSKATTNRVTLGLNTLAANEWWHFEGVSLVLPTLETYSGARSISIQSNGGVDTKFSVSGLGSVIGDAGSNSWDFGRIGAQYDGLYNWEDGVCEFLIWDSLLSDSTLLPAVEYLESKWGIS
jgi:hypothetical protein